MSIGRNSIYNVVGQLSPLAVQIFTVPLYLQVFGLERYGTITLGMLIMGYFGGFSLGLATTQHVAVKRVEGNLAAAEAFWSAVIASLLAGFVLAAIFAVCSYIFFDQVLTVGAATRSEILTSLPLLALSIPIGSLGSSLSGALQGEEKFLELNIIGLLGSMLLAVVPLLAGIYIEPKLTNYFTAALLAQLSIIAVLAWRCAPIVRAAPEARPSFTQMKILGVFSGWIGAVSLVWPLMAMMDRLVIGALVGAAAVVTYSIPFNLANKTVFLAQAIGSAILPRISAASEDGRRELTKSGTIAVASLSAPFFAAAILFSEPFFAVWISQEFSVKASTIGRLLLLGFYVAGTGQVGFVNFIARGRPDICGKELLLEFPVYLAVFFLLISQVGLLGGAIAFTLRNFWAGFFYNWFPLGKDAPWRVLIPLWALMGIITFSAEVTKPWSLGWWAASSGLSCLVLVLSWALAPPEFKVMIIEGIGRLRRRGPRAIG